MFYLFGWRHEGDQAGGADDILAMRPTVEYCMHVFDEDYDVGQIKGLDANGRERELRWQTWVDNDSPRLWREWREWSEEKREFVREHRPE